MIRSILVLLSAILVATPATAKIVGWEESEIEILFNYLDPNKTGDLSLQDWFNRASDLKLNKMDATAPPTSNDDIDEGYEIGSMWLDLTNDKAYLCLDNTDGAPVWLDLTSGSGSSTDTNAVHVNGTSEIAGITEETTPTGSDLLLLEKASDGTKRKLQVSNLPVDTDQINSGGSSIVLTGTTRTDKINNVTIASFTDNEVQYGPVTCDDADLDADDTFCPEASRVVVAGTALSPYDLVYQSTSTGKWILSPLTTRFTRAKGIVARIEYDANSNGNIDADDTFLMMIKGKMRNDQWTTYSANDEFCQDEVTAGDFVDCTNAAICNADNDIGYHIGTAAYPGTIISFDFTREPVICNGN